MSVIPATPTAAQIITVHTIKPIAQRTAPIIPVTTPAVAIPPINPYFLAFVPHIAAAIPRPIPIIAPYDIHQNTKEQMPITKEATAKFFPGCTGGMGGWYWGC